MPGRVGIERRRARDLVIIGLARSVCGAEDKERPGISMVGVVAKHSITRIESAADDIDQLVAIADPKLLRELPDILIQNGRAHVSTPVTNTHLVCRLLLEK